MRADLDSIAALGLDHVRVFPLWPVFQPNRTLIRPRAVEQLVALADAAGERGLDVNVDGLQGHLSSFDFQPVVDPHLAPPEHVHRPGRGRRPRPSICAPWPRRWPTGPTSSG